MIYNFNHEVHQYFQSVKSFSPSETDTKCVFAEHYKFKAVTGASHMNNFQFFFQDDDDKDILPEVYYCEDAEKAIQFLKSDLLKLVGRAPVVKQVIDILFIENYLERGVTKDKYSTKRIQTGSYETSNFAEILSKEIAVKFVKLAEKSYNSKLNPIQRVLEINNTDKLHISEMITSSIDVMNLRNKKHPNLILLPTDIYNTLFDTNAEVSIITNSGKKYENIDVWINPHVSDVVLYYNPYYIREMAGKKIWPSVIFFPEMMFAKTITRNLCHWLTPEEKTMNQVSDILNEPGKHHFRYSLAEIGTNVENNYYLIPKK